MVEAAGGPLVGYAHVHAGEEGDGLVDPEWRGRGIGTWLLRWVVERAAAQLAAAGRRDGSLQAWTNHADGGCRRLLEREGFAYQRSQLVATALCFDYGSEGWVRQLAVRRRERRQGLGLALLRHAFGVFRLRGRPAVGLAVDSDNSTGANRLYERAGMRVERRFDRYVRPLRLEAGGRLVARS